MVFAKRKYTLSRKERKAEVVRNEFITWDCQNVTRSSDLPYVMLAASCLFLVSSCQLIDRGKSNMPEPPVAQRISHSESHHGIRLEDPYHWLKDQSYPVVDDKPVLDYLNAENAYFDRVMGPLQPKVEQIFDELKGRVEPNESSVPIKVRGYVYQSKYVDNSQYQVHLRWPFEPGSIADGSYLEPPDEGVAILMDENELAKDTEYFRLGAFVVSPDDALLAYSTDTNGSERYTLVVKDLASNELLSDRIEEVGGSPVWSSDGKSFLYVKVNENWRPYKVLLHRLGTSSDEDVTLYEESDEGFFVSIFESTSQEFAIVSTGDHVSSEVRVVELDDLSGELRLIEVRQPGHEYDVDHQPGRFWIRTNDTHKNFRLVTTDESALGQSNWQTVIAGTDDVYLTSCQSFTSHVVVSAREQGLDQVLIINKDGSRKSIEFPEAAYSAYVYGNPEPDPSQLRLGYSSMVTPSTTYDYDFKTEEMHVRKVREIPSGYDASLYATERRMVSSHDGVKVPVSIVYARDTPLDGSAPLYLYGYGAYGASMDPSFGSARISLLERGFVYAIAHIRGGSEMGYGWYEDGKLDKRTNTFKDFVAVARYLVDENFTSAGQIAIAGDSAGGSLVGAATNLAPELWGSVVAHVPFVDILNTMLDTSLPLTPIEWPEWGNPIEDPKAFEYIRSYSPYDQLDSHDYPPMLVTAGLNDPRVTYWEPAKYVAKLRTLKTDSNLLLLKTEMSAGHGGKSGRMDSLREVAEEYVFILHSMGLLKN